MKFPSYHEKLTNNQLLSIPRLNDNGDEPDEERLCAASEG
jgi:hypothetical protein